MRCCLSKFSEDTFVTKMASPQNNKDDLCGLRLVGLRYCKKSLINQIIIHLVLELYAISDITSRIYIVSVILIAIRRVSA